MDDPRAGEALNELLRNAVDSAEGYRQAASLARNPTFQSVFRDRAEAREGLVRTLEGEARSFGAPPVQMGTLIGEAHKVFTFARNAVSRTSDKGLIEELARREGLVIRNFTAVAEDVSAPEPARRIAADALADLTAAQRELEGLGEAFAGAREPDPSQDPTLSYRRRPHVAAHYKLSEQDTHFLDVPKGAEIIFSGSSGTQTWIERAQETVVRIGIQTVGVAIGEGASLSVCIEVGDQSALGEDGPAALETHLNASQSVQLVVKPGDRVAFKAYPKAENVQVLRTVVWASDLGRANG
jgi:uncharacterized protein (TIGR02284 family)